MQLNKEKQPKKTQKIISTNERGISHDGRTGRRSFIFFIKLGQNLVEIRRRRRNRANDVEDKRDILGFKFMLFDFLIK